MVLNSHFRAVSPNVGLPRGGAGGISPPVAIWKVLPGQVWFKDMDPWPPLSTPGSVASTYQAGPQVQQSTGEVQAPCSLGHPFRKNVSRAAISVEN